MNYFESLADFHMSRSGQCCHCFWRVWRFWGPQHADRGDCACIGEGVKPSQITGQLPHTLFSSWKLHSSAVLPYDPTSFPARQPVLHHGGDGFQGRQCACFGVSDQYQQQLRPQRLNYQQWRHPFWSRKSDQWKRNKHHEQQQYHLPVSMSGPHSPFAQASTIPACWVFSAAVST
jgi:hypothetical protein